MVTSTLLCRACKRRPPAKREINPDEDPIVTEALEQIRKKNDGLCHECACVSLNASIDQSLEKIRRKP